MQDEVKNFWKGLKEKTSKAAIKEDLDKIKKEFVAKKGEVGKLFKRVADVAHKEKKEIDKMLSGVKKEAVSFIEQQRKIIKGTPKSGEKKVVKKKAATKKTAAKKTTSKKSRSKK